MRILITGGAGFIGSHLCDRLLADGHSVIAVDNLSTGSTDNIAHLAGHERFSFIKHDVTNYIFVEGSVDAVLHLASLPSPVDYLNFPIQTLKVGALGTHKTLGLAKEKGAKFLLASTSEVYGDPLVHPQPEDYWGNVNPIGPRGVYDESKRFAESLTMAYHRYHDVDTRIVRIFNSIMADERIVVFNDGQLYAEAVESYFSRLEQAGDITQRRIHVPAFDPQSGQIALRPVSAVIQHPCVTDAFEVTLRYGRKLRVTGDHSVFRQGADGRPVAIPVRQLTRDDRVAIPACLPVVEKDWPQFSISEHLLRRLAPAEWWNYHVVAPQMPSLIDRHRQELQALIASGDSKLVTRPWSAANIISDYRRRSSLPLYLMAELAIPVPEEARLCCGRGQVTVPDRIFITPDILWLLGLFLAGGTGTTNQRGTYSFYSDAEYLRRARTIITATFGTDAGWVEPSPGRGPTIYTPSKLLHFVFDQVLGLNTEWRVPTWVLQLPLARLKWFLQGYKDGNGAHGGRSVGPELCFNASSPGLADDLDLLLLRFGLVAAHDRSETTLEEQYGAGKSPWQRLTLQGLSDYDLLHWDNGVRQNLQSQRWGDLVWAPVESVKPCVLTSQVYDFSVPGYENFLAGNGVFAHNTYGPRMRMDDGRVVPNFVRQALLGEPLTVYDDGQRTRSFCYVSDMVEGMVRLLASGVHEPVNMGNPREMTILEFAHHVLEVVESDSQITFIRPTDERTADDPKTRQPDIGRAKQVLGWEPLVPLEEGLARTADDFRRRLGL